MTLNIAFTFFVITVLTLTQLVMGTGNPIQRLWLLPLLVLLYYSKFFLNKINFSNSKKIITALIIVFTILVASRCVHFGFRMSKPVAFIEDIAVVNYKAIEMITNGQNPYSEIHELDPYPAHGKIYSGFKYPPFQLLYYSPFTKIFGIKGIYLGNFFIYFALLFFIVFILWRQNKFNAMLAGCIYLSIDFNFVRAFNNGTNDYLPTLLLLFTIYFSFVSNKERTSGILYGLSALAKPLPSGILGLQLILKKKYKLLGCGALTFIVLALPFLIWDLKAFWDNVFWFNLVREPRETATLSFVSPMIGNIIFISIFLCSHFINFFEKRFRQYNLWFTPFILITIFVTASKLSKSQYFVWALPFMLLWFFSNSTLENSSEKE